MSILCSAGQQCEGGACFTFMYGVCGCLGLAAGWGSCVREGFFGYFHKSNHLMMMDETRQKLHWSSC